MLINGDRKYSLSCIDYWWSLLYWLILIDWSKVRNIKKVQCTACNKFFCSNCYPENDSLSSINFSCSPCQNSSPKKISPKVEKTKRQKKNEKESIKLWNCPNDWCHYFIGRYWGGSCSKVTNHNSFRNPQQIRIRPNPIDDPSRRKM